MNHSKKYSPVKGLTGSLRFVSVGQKFPVFVLKSDSGWVTFEFSHFQGRSNHFCLALHALESKDSKFQLNLIENLIAFVNLIKSCT
jgi:hypothetical protein